MLAEDGFFPQSAHADTAPNKFLNPLAPKNPHFAGKAKSVIFLYMYGGPSQIDTFDYKPTMYGMDNKTIEVKTFGRGGHRNQGRIVEPRWKFKQFGECGKWVERAWTRHAGRVCHRFRLHGRSRVGVAGQSARMPSRHRVALKRESRGDAVT